MKADRLLVYLGSRTVAARGAAELQLIAGRLRVHFAASRAEALAAAPRAEVIWGLPDAAVLAAAPRLKWFQQFSSGMEWLAGAERLARPHLLLTSVSDRHFRSVAMHAMSFLLAHVRRLPDAWRHQQRRQWRRPGDSAPELWDLAGRHLLVLGVGSIGSEVARLARSFGMRVSGVATTARSVRGFEIVQPMAAFAALLPAVDVVVNTLPLTQQTRGLVNDAFFAGLKRGGYFVNVGRGATVDERALIRALHCGRLAGAGLDVFEREPLRRNSVLWRMSTVQITGHYAGTSETNAERFWSVALDNLKRYYAKRPLRNRVDPARLY
jgi:D-2-hydroxyacid dehydrogenase (NADP+)